VSEEERENVKERVKTKVKVNFILQIAMKTLKGRRSVTVLFL
jgi:hypothetical protein